MKKFLLMIISLALFNIGFADNNVPLYANTDFTFEAFNPESNDVLSIQPKNISLSDSVITYPVFYGPENITKEINKEVEKFVKKFKGSKSKVFSVSYQIVGSNDLFASILFDITEMNSKKGTSNYKDAITFNVRNGKKVILDDLFLPGYHSSLHSAVVSKVKLFKIDLIKDKKGNFKGLSKKQKFYLEDDSLVLLYDKNEATNFADGQLYIPFLFIELIGLLK